MKTLALWSVLLVLLVVQVSPISLPDVPDDHLQEVKIDWTKGEEEENSECQVLFLNTLQEVD